MWPSVSGGGRFVLFLKYVMPLLRLMEPFLMERVHFQVNRMASFVKL